MARRTSPPWTTRCAAPPRWTPWPNPWSPAPGFRRSPADTPTESQDQMNIRVGVIGTGIMGADHVTTLHRQISGAAVSMVADVDLARAQGIGDGIAGARAMAAGCALIADPEVDAVVIASHDSTHAGLAVAAVRAGKPVLCEKPLAPTVAECLHVVRAERDAIASGGSSLISLGFMRRFDPGYVQLKAALDAGEGGAPLVLHCISRGVSSAPGASNESSVTGLSLIHIS